jgi:hypothetical protein
MARAEAVWPGMRRYQIVGVNVAWKCRFPFVGGRSRTNRRGTFEQRIALEKFDKFLGIDQVRGDPDAAGRAFSLCGDVAGLFRRK